MRYNPVLHKKSRASRRGIAVMFALGILSLVIVAVLIFSQRAVTDRKVASAYSRYSESKDLAQSAFERALLQFKKNAASGSAFHSVKVGSDDDYDWLWKLDPERRILPRDGSCPVRWQYVRDSDGHIIGRYAYIIIGEKRLNLNAILDHSFCKAGASCDGGSGCLRAQRRGNTAAELQFDPSAFSSVFSFGGGEFNAENLQAVKDGDDVRQYASPEALYPACSPKTGWTQADVRNRINALLNISLSDAVKEPDAWFGGDKNSNGTKDKTEFYQRFPLMQKNWSTVTVNDILKPAEAFYEGESPKSGNSAGIPWLKNWSDTEGNWPNAATKSKQIAANLINYCAPETRAVVSDVDPASWSFTNVPTYTGNKRTGYLNECYVKLKVTAEIGKMESHPVGLFGLQYWVSYGNGSQPNKIKAELIVKPEIIDMYYGEVDNSYSVKVFGDVSFKYDKWSYSDLGTSYTNSDDFGLTYSANDIFAPKGDGGNLLGGFTCSALTGSSGYKTCYFSGGGGDSSMVGRVDVGAFAEGPFTIIPSPDYTKFFKIKNVSIKLKLAVTKDGKNVDFVELPEIKANDVFSFDDSGATVVEKCFSANDPRHNLHAADWTEQDETLGSVNAGLTCTGGAFSSENGWNRDPEAASDPANKSISTAYIRHAPMESIWELGAIHRAAPWQTINLKKPKACTDTLTTDLTAKGGGAYGEGDFRILDQVTMQGGTSYTPLGLFGKVNLNAPGTATRRFVFDSLFRKMPWSTSGYTRTSTTEVTGDNARTLANKLGTAPNYVKLYRRSDIYQAPSGAAFWDLIEKSPLDGTTPLATDAQQEQLVGRFIGLTTADTTPDSATIIVLAQSIKDMGGNAKVYPDWDENGSVSGNTGTDKAKLKAGYYSYAEDGTSITDPGFFSVPSNIPNEVTAKFGRYDNGADRITGETRMVGRLLYDRVQGKWKIVQVQNED